MGLSTKEREERLRSLAETCFGKPVHYASLRAAACRKWGITSKTAEDYINGLIDGHVLAHDPPGGPLKVTPAGERWLDGLPIDAASPEVPDIKDPEPIELSDPRPRTPPSPSPKPEGEG